MKSNKLEFTAEQITNSALAALIAQHTVALPPKGAMTIAQFAAKIKRAPRTARLILEKSKLRRGVFRNAAGKATMFYW